METTFWLPKVRKWGSELGGFGIVNGREVMFNAYGAHAVEFILPGMDVNVGILGVTVTKKI